MIELLAESWHLSFKGWFEQLRSEECLDIIIGQSNIVW
jgi:hypothetical protein